MGICLNLNMNIKKYFVPREFFAAKGRMLPSASTVQYRFYCIFILHYYLVAGPNTKNVTHVSTN